MSIWQHCAGVNCLSLLKSSVTEGCDYLFSGSRDGTLKRWSLGEDAATCSATFESHVDWVYHFFLQLFIFILFDTPSGTSIFLVHTSVPFVALLSGWYFRMH